MWLTCFAAVTATSQVAASQRHLYFIASRSHKWHATVTLSVWNTAWTWALAATVLLVDGSLS